MPITAARLLVTCVGLLTLGEAARSHAQAPGQAPAATQTAALRDSDLRGRVDSAEQAG